MSLKSGFYSLGAKLNKLVSSEVEDTQEGTISPLLDELELKMDDDELIELKKDWETRWNEYIPEVLKKQKENEEYWLGKHFSDVHYKTGTRPLTDNLIFEALETFLPIATRANPEPTVESDNTEEGIALAGKVRKMLVYLADTLRVKLRIKKVTRFWAIYLLGVGKIGWSEINNEISFQIIRPQKLILDPNGTVDEDMQYTGEYVGEHRKDSASTLVRRFPNKASYIKDKVEGKMGTQLQYMEWWTDDFVFWTLEDEVLGKAKNMHWNYDTEGQGEMDEFGEAQTQQVKGNNHFPVPKKPYIFLSVFNLGKHPHDDTSLIGQNLSLQDVVNKRQRQIDKNADKLNGGWAVSGERSGLSKEGAEQAMAAAEKGGGFFIPTGDVRGAVTSLTGTPLPSDVFAQLSDTRNEMRNIFGTRGSSPQGTLREQTVRGKIIIAEQDTSRIGGGISEYIEQFTDQLFNWFVQMMHVYYDEEHYASVMGSERAREYISIINTDLNRKLMVSVKEGSLVPTDSLTRRNEAIDLWAAQAIDPITLFDRLEFPSPRDTAKQLWMWQNAPDQLFKDDQEIQQVVAGQKQEAQQETQQSQQEEQAKAQQDLQGKLQIEQTKQAGALPPLQ